MILTTHIILAISALVLSTINFFAPANSRLKISYLMAAGTLSSGVLLIVFSNAGIIKTCLTGIAFFAVVSLLNELARNKLAVAAVKIKKN